MWASPFPRIPRSRRVRVAAATAPSADKGHDDNDGFAGQRKVVLDLGAVSYMDSTSLGELVSGFVTMRKQGGTLHVANLTARVEQMMTIAQLAKVFQIFGSEEEAVRSLAPGQRES